MPACSIASPVATVFPSYAGSKNLRSAAYHQAGLSLSCYCLMEGFIGCGVAIWAVIARLIMALICSKRAALGRLLAMLWGSSSAELSDGWLLLKCERLLCCFLVNSVSAVPVFSIIGSNCIVSGLGVTCCPVLARDWCVSSCLLAGKLLAGLSNCVLMQKRTLSGEVVIAGSFLGTGGSEMNVILSEVALYGEDSLSNDWDDVSICKWKFQNICVNLKSFVLSLNSIMAFWIAGLLIAHTAGYLNGSAAEFCVFCGLAKISAPCAG